MMIPGTEDLQLIVEMKDPSVLEQMSAGESMGQPRGASPLANRTLDLTSAKALNYRQLVARGQQSLRNSILALPDAQVQGTADIVMNALIARVHASHYSAIRRLPGVKKV